MNRIKVISSEIVSTFRRIKFFRMGGYDTRTANESGPFGFDGNPIKDMIAIYAETSVNGRQVVIGYIHKNQLAEPGESRMFSLDSEGNLKAFIWCKVDGKLELNGNADNAVRFSPLNSGAQDLKDKINAELTKIQTAIVGLGGSYAKVNVSIDISGAKIDEITTS